MVVRVPGTLGKLEGDVGGAGSLGRRRRTRRLDGGLVHIRRRTTGDMKSSMVAAGH